MAVPIPTADMAMAVKRAEQCVRNGAGWLDDNVPGWAEQIDVATLDMSSDTEDILGQLTGFASDGEEGASYSWWVDYSRWRRHLVDTSYRMLVCDCAIDEGCNIAEQDEEDHESYVENTAWYGFTDQSEGVTYAALTFAWREELRDRGNAPPPPEPVVEVDDPSPYVPSPDTEPF